MTSGNDHFTKNGEHFSKPSVSVLVPAFKAQAYICETLDSLDKQVFKDFQLLISVDKSDDDTELITKRWCQEHKNIPTQIFCQTHLLGWIKNVNFLLEKCQTKYFNVLSHDDLLHETYLQKMVQCLKVNPQACTAFSDVQGFGTKKLIYNQKSIRGERLERSLEFLQTFFDAVPYRGLVNRAVLSDFLLLPENDCSNFAIDIIWNLQMALKGDLIRVPEVLYHKRYHDHEGSFDNSWEKLSQVNKTKARLEHHKDCLKTIFRAGLEQQELARLIEASKSRFLHELWDYDEKDRVPFVETLLERTIIALDEAKNKQSSQFLHMKHV